MILEQTSAGNNLVEYRVELKKLTLQLGGSEVVFHPKHVKPRELEAARNWGSHIWPQWFSKN